MDAEAASTIPDDQAAFDREIDTRSCGLRGSEANDLERA
jgi:hypothetical protein